MKTEDGVKLKVGDIFYGVVKDERIRKYKYSTFMDKCKNIKDFSTKKLAEEYLTKLNHMKPKTQEQAVLRLLIDNNFMTPLKFVRAGIISYGQRIGDLRKMITVKCDEVKFKNKFGHAAIHGKWSLSNKAQAEKLYSKLLKESK